ncbi:MAG TPA: chromate efflux transporter [Rhodothermales bacterium]|nr:chromate efflux transporter [Rhodothermales bacterium]
MATPQDTSPTSLGTLARLFFKLGVIGFGGPAAHIAMLEDEVVTRRGWFTREHFLDLIGATNLIPGPNSTEMTMHIGYERCGWAGLFTAGGCFILPAALMTGTLGWLYVAYGTLPEVEPFLRGIKPAVLAVILGALWKLGRSAVKNWQLVPVGVAVAVALALGVNEVVALLCGGVLGMLWLVGYQTTRDQKSFLPLAPFLPFPLSPFLPYALSQTQDIPLWKLFLFFLKVGAVLYGSGYVLIAFLEGDLVQTYGWLTEQQLLDAIAIGQFTPGPVLTTATFIGYMLAGLPGAVVATLGIFLPSFIFVAILNPIIPKLRKSKWTAAFLDAVNVSAVALMLVVTVRLGLSVLTSWPAWVIFGLAVLAVLRFKLNAAYLVLGGALLGWLFGVL